MAKVKYRMVIVKSSGAIAALGGIYAPILTPVALNVATILKMIIEGHQVYDVSSNGQVLLNTKNYDDDFGSALPPEEVTPPWHPTGDGNMHVPATGNTSAGKILVAGDGPGRFGWRYLTWDLITMLPEWLSIKNLKKIFTFKEHIHNKTILRPTFVIPHAISEGVQSVKMSIPMNGLIDEYSIIFDKETLTSDLKFNIQRIGLTDYNNNRIELWETIGTLHVPQSTMIGDLSLIARTINKGDIIRLDVLKGFDGGGVKELNFQLTLKPILSQDGQHNIDEYDQNLFDSRKKDIIN